ncbi:hypothetical protein EYF80_059701 [Liparis tanakae]|uniref:Uncharacterized protein n=1 Tax=Liparis tanakae TaxID=230148 RepID=A0A4Z2EN15_9TELE|nr:hypothetical protein EYF80_059701 [Liparis tanakae]
MQCDEENRILKYDTIGRQAALSSRVTAESTQGSPSGGEEDGKRGVFTAAGAVFVTFHLHPHSFLSDVM